MADEEKILPCLNTDSLILDRIARVETEIKVRFEEWDKARVLAHEAFEKDIVLAREQVDKELKLAKEMHDVEWKRTQEQIQFKLDIQNQYQKKIDRLENTFTSKDVLTNLEEKIKLFHASDIKIIDHQFDTVKRLVYTGVGIAIGLHLVSGFLFIMFRHLIGG